MLQSILETYAFMFGALRVAAGKDVDDMLNEVFDEVNS